MELQAKQRLIANGVSMTFSVGLAKDKRTFTERTNHGQDGNGSEVYSAKKQNGFYCVLIVNDGKLIAMSADNLKDTVANKMADYAVEHNLKTYWDSNDPMKRYYLNH